MKKSILNLGKALNKAEQKKLMGGWKQCYNSTQNCCVRYDAGCNIFECATSGEFAYPLCPVSHF